MSDNVHPGAPWGLRSARRRQPRSFQEYAGVAAEELTVVLSGEYGQLLRQVIEHVAVMQEFLTDDQKAVLAARFGSLLNGDPDDQTPPPRPRGAR